jgi:hypothetical protein
VNCFHSGCIGDIIYSIPTLRALGCKKLYIDNRPWTKPIVTRIGAFARLIESQGISVHKHAGEEIDFDISTYRHGGGRYGETISNRVSRWMGVNIDTSVPWLDINEKSSETKGKILIARCPRWHGALFPWKEIVENFKKDILFVGLKDEHMQFTRSFGKVAYLPTIDLYDVAIAINGCDTFIGNQSSPMAIAEGLKHNAIQECCLYAYDCIYNRHNKRNINYGELEFEFKGRKFKHVPKPPKRGWEINRPQKTYRANDVNLLVSMCRADLTLEGNECSVDEITSWVKRY